MKAETKQQVFNAAVEKAVSMTLIAGFEQPYSDKYREDMQKRYAAATNGDAECPYCHNQRPIVAKDGDSHYFIFTRWGEHTLDYDHATGHKYRLKSISAQCVAGDWRAMMTKIEKWFLKVIYITLLLVGIGEVLLTTYAFFYLSDAMVIIGLCCLMLTVLGYLVIELEARK